jgi:hypothetical protein
LTSESRTDEEARSVLVWLAVLFGFVVSVEAPFDPLLGVLLAVPVKAPLDVPVGHYVWCVCRAGTQPASVPPCTSMTLIMVVTVGDSVIADSRVVSCTHVGA